jgi:hypothetical protein
MILTREDPNSKNTLIVNMINLMSYLPTTWLFFYLSLVGSMMIAAEFDRDYHDSIPRNYYRERAENIWC